MKLFFEELVCWSCYKIVNCYNFVSRNVVMQGNEGVANKYKYLLSSWKCEWCLNQWMLHEETLFWGIDSTCCMASHLTVFHAWNSRLHLLVTPVQLTRPGIGQTCPAQWVTLHNNLGLPLCLGRFTSLIVQAPIGRRYFRCSVFTCVCTCWVNIVITHNVVTPSLLSQLAYIVCFEHAILPHLAKCCVLRLIPMPHLTISLLLGWCAESPHYTHAHLILNLE